MEDSKSITKNDDVEDQLYDAFDEFPLDDCFNSNGAADQSVSTSFSSYRLQQDEVASLRSPRFISPTGPRRRRSRSQRIREAASGNDADPNSSVTFDSTAADQTEKIFARKLNEYEGENGDSDLPLGEISSERVSNSVNDETEDDFAVRLDSAGRADLENSEANSSVSFDSVTTPGRKYRFSRNLRDHEREGDKTESSSHILNEENEENETASAANDGTGIDDSSSGFLFGLAGLIIKAIGLQLRLLVSFVTFPIQLLYCTYMFVIDPFQAVRRVIQYVKGRLFEATSVVCENFMQFASEWLKEHKSLWELVLRIGWGFLWATYVCVVLVSLLVSAFVLSGIVMRHLVEEPIHMKEALSLDYTRNSPVALVPIVSCPGETRGVSFGGKSELGSMASPRVIPPNHKLQATVSLMLPESDYNRKLGIFQVRIDFLSANGKTLASLRRPCMLHFKSQPIRLLLTFLKIAPLVAGYSSESQTLNINLRGFTEGQIPTACLSVTIEQRAEFRPGAGIPEIYDASLTLESELPLLKKVIWHWKKTLFIWLGMTIFTMQFLFSLICCRPFILPRGRVRDRSTSNIGPQSHHPAQS